MPNSDVLVRMKADTSNYDANLAKARRQLEGFRKDNLSLGGVMKQMSGSLVGMATQFASVTAAVGALSSAIRSNIETARNFEKSMSQLSSLTGMTGDDLNRLKEYSIELGSTTTLSASEVANAFKMIGSQQPQLLASGEALKQVTQYAITLSEAAGIELSTAAQTLSTSINQMGGDSNNAARYINVLAAASQKGAGDIGWLGGAVENSAAVAKAAGTDFEELVANLETLAQAGFDASTAGTALRGIIGSLENQTDQNLKPSVVGLTTAFENLAAKQLDIAGYQALLGKNFYSQGMILADNAEKTRKLTEDITGTNTALDQARTNTDNLDGSLKSLASAWEGLNLHINSSNGLLRDAVDWLTELIRTADKAFTTIGDSSMWETYKAGLKEVSDGILQTIGPLSTLVRMIGMIGGGSGSGDKPLGAVIGSIVPKGAGGAGGGTGGNVNEIELETKSIKELQDELKKLKKLRDDAANAGNLTLRDQYNKQIKSVNDQIKTLRGGNVSHTETPQEKAAKIVATAERTYAETLTKNSIRLEAGLESTIESKKKELAAQERLFDAYSDAYATYSDPKYKQAIEDVVQKIRGLAGEVRNMELAAKTRSYTFSDKIHRSVLAENEETKTHLNDKNFIGDSMKGLDEKVLTTIAERQAAAAKKVQEAWKQAGTAVGMFGNVLGSLKDPAAQIGATVAQAIATVALAYADSLAKDEPSKKNIWAFIAASAAAMVSMATTISTIHSSTGYASGGVVGGSHYSGDMEYARLNAGETVLTQAQTGIVASALQSGTSDLHLETDVRGDTLRLILRRGNMKRGYGSRSLVL